MNYILTMRKVPKGRFPHFDIVYEWENELSKYMGLQLINITSFDIFLDYIYKILDKYVGIHPKIIRKIGNSKKLYIEMSTSKYDSWFNRKGIICWIVDYFLTDEEYSNFITNHMNMEKILVSNREVYDYLCKKGCPFNIKHVPLAIPDEWIFTKQVRYEKKFDIVLVGRPNNILIKWMFMYLENHREIKILATSEVVVECLKSYSNGKFTGNIHVKYAKDRKTYMDCLRQSKIMFYATPGMDGGKERTKGWNQITPRFLEGMSAQCHIVCRYEENADTQWYGIDKMFPNCNSFKIFCEEVQKGLYSEIDLDLYWNYLNMNGISARISKLED